MRRLFTSSIICILFLSAASAQSNVWTLHRCVQYALEHNISIQQDVLNKRLAEYTLLQSRLAQLPSVNGSASYSRSYGRSINPITNQFIEGSYDYVGLSGNANVLVFGWFQQRNLISKNKFTLEASKADLEQLRNDVSLNVATGYLRALLAQEQIRVSENQVDLSKAQLDQTKHFADAGRLPELNVAQLESQLATDSSNLINAIATYNSAILDLKTLLNLDFNTSMEILAPDVNVTDQVAVADLRPENIYAEARTHFGSVRAAEFKVKAANKGLWAAKGALLPQLSIGAQMGSNWADNYYSYSQTSTLLSLQPIGIAYPSLDTVYQPVYQYQQSKVPFNTQLNNNFRQTVGLSLNIPIFNGWQSQYSVKQSKINLQAQELNEYQAELTLKQNVYKAYNDAINSVQKYNAALRAEGASQRALDFAKKRYDLGLTSTVDFLVTQNSHYSAAANLLSAKYDLIFKLKVIDYYLGKELKL